MPERNESRSTTHCCASASGRCSSPRSRSSTTAIRRTGARRSTELAAVVGLARVCASTSARRRARLRADPRHELGRARDSDLSARAAARADAVGIAISSASIYAFAGSLKLGRVLRAQARASTRERVRTALQQNPTTIVTAWSFLPIVPTDLICYVCGVMRISFRRFMFGVLVGEGAICAIYIFAGSQLARSRQALVRRRRGRSTSRRAACGCGRVRRALRALSRAGRRAHSASLGVAADVRRRASCARSTRARCSRSRCR